MTASELHHRLGELIRMGHGDLPTYLRGADGYHCAVDDCGTDRVIELVSPDPFLAVEVS